MYKRASPQYPWMLTRMTACRHIRKIRASAISVETCRIPLSVRRGYGNGFHITTPKRRKGLVSPDRTAGPLPATKCINYWRIASSHRWLCMAGHSVQNPHSSRLSKICDLNNSIPMFVENPTSCVSLVTHERQIRPRSRRRDRCARRPWRCAAPR